MATILCISLCVGYNGPIKTYASEMGQEINDAVSSESDTTTQEENIPESSSEDTGAAVETETTTDPETANTSENEVQGEADTTSESDVTQEADGGSGDAAAPEAEAEVPAESGQDTEEVNSDDQTGIAAETATEGESNSESESDQVPVSTASEADEDISDKDASAETAVSDEPSDEVIDDIESSEEDTEDNSDPETTTESIADSAFELQPEEVDETEYPDFYKEFVIEGYTITIDADEGILPEDVICKVKKIERLSGKNVDQLAQERIGEYRGLIDAAAFDISFWFDGKEIEPEGDVTVNYIPSQEAKNKLQDHLQDIHGAIPDAGRAYDLMEDYEDMSAAEMSQEEILNRGPVSSVDLQALNAPIEDPEPVDISEYLDNETVEIFHFEDGLDSQKLKSDKTDDSLEVSCETDSFSPYMFVISVKNLISSESVVDSGKETIIDLSPYKEAMSAPYEEGYESPVCEYLKEALALAKNNATASKPYHIIMPSGTYGFCSDEYTGLYIYSNTILELQSDTVFKNDPYNMRMIRALNTSSKKGYSTFSNISIIGGVWDANAKEKDDIDYKGTIMQFNSITGLTIKDCVLKDTYDSHHMLLSNAQKVLISGCVFQDTRNEGNSHEALQITMESKDISPSRDIEISGCTFSNVYYGLGGHHGSVGHPYENIYVHDCTFNNIANRAIWAYNWKNCRIVNNTMNNVGIGIDFDSLAGDDFWNPDKASIDVMTITSGNTISGNNISVNPEGFSGDKVGIRVGGAYSAKLGGYYLHYGDEIIGNTISGLPEKAIWVQYSDNTEIKNNTIANASNDGIKLMYLGKASEISGNRINAYTNYGIDVVLDSIVRYQHDNYIYDYGNDRWLHVDEDSQAVGFLVNQMYGGVNEKVNIISYGRSDMEKTYSSANKSIAKIKASKVVCKKKGSVTITVTQGEARGDITLSVKKAPKKITLKKSKTLRKGKTYQLLPTVNKAANCESYNFKYKSSNKKIASVSKTGLVKAKRKGTTTISVKTYNGVEKIITIKVK